MKPSAVDERGKLAAWLRSRYGRKPVRHIAESIANELLSTVREPGPPVSVEPLLAARRVAAVRRIRGGRRSRMPQDGRLLVTDHGFAVEVKSGPETRVRFTLAHEIGHTVFYDLDTSPPQRLVPGGTPKDEERFCNLFAAELLMPRGLVQTELNKVRRGGDEPASPTAAIVRLAQSFRVSIEAMARRLVEDLGVLEGIALGSRWMPGLDSSLQVAPSDQAAPSEHAWRLSWWAASPAVVDPLYLPLAAKRPKVGLHSIENGFLEGVPAHVQLPLNEIRLGNLRKILSLEPENRSFVDAWIHPVIPQGVQLGSRGSVELGSSNPEEVLRQSSEVAVFFALHRAAPPAPSHSPPPPLP